MERQTEEGVIIEGKNAEEALQAACDKLNSTPNQVEYEVLESAKSGVLGLFKGKAVRIRVWEKPAAQRLVSEIVKQLFEKMGLDVDYRVTQGEDAYEIDLQTSDADGLLIGRGGDTLKALQHLISRMVGKRDENARVRVDVAGYRKRRHEQLRRKAQDLAERALSGGRDALSELLPADERRIIHLTLADDDSVATRAIGDGQVKRVAVCPVASHGGAAGGRDRRGRSPRRSGLSRGGSRNSSRQGRTPQARRHSEEKSSQPTAAQTEPSEKSGYTDGDVESRRHRVGERDRKRWLPRKEQPPEEGTQNEGERSQSQAPTSRSESGGRFSETETSSPGAARKPSSNEKTEVPQRADDPGSPEPVEAKSYFNIPESIKREDQDEKEAKTEDSSDQMTWGRKRRPGRGKR